MATDTSTTTATDPAPPLPAVPLVLRSPRQGGEEIPPLVKAFFNRLERRHTIKTYVNELMDADDIPGQLHFLKITCLDTYRNNAQELSNLIEGLKPFCNGTWQQALNVGIQQGNKAVLPWKRDNWNNEFVHHFRRDDHIFRALFIVHLSAHWVVQVELHYQ